MAAVHISEVSLSRTPFEAPPARVHISEVSLSRTPAPGTGGRVHVSSVRLTRGHAAPVTEGAILRRVSGAWVPYVIKARFNGEWI